MFASQLSQRLTNQFLGYLRETGLFPGLIDEREGIFRHHYLLRGHEGANHIAVDNPLVAQVGREIRSRNTPDTLQQIKNGVCGNTTPQCSQNLVNLKR